MDEGRIHAHVHSVYSTSCQPSVAVSQGNRTWNFAAARRHRYRRAGARVAAAFSPPPPSGGRSGGGSRPRVRRRTQARCFLTDERDRKGPRPGRRTPGSTPPPDLRPSRGRREDGAARLTVQPSRAFPNGAPTPPLWTGEESGRGTERGRTDAEPPQNFQMRSPCGKGSHTDMRSSIARAIALGNFGAARRHRYRRPGGARGRRFLSSPLQGGGREGGPAPGSAGVPPAWRAEGPLPRSRFARCRRDAGAPRQFTDERGQEDPRPGRRTPGSTPPPDLPPEGGRREDGAARLPVQPSRAVPNGTPNSSLWKGGRVKTESQVRLPWRFPQGDRIRESVEER